MKHFIEFENEYMFLSQYIYTVYSMLYAIALYMETLNATFMCKKKKRKKMSKKKTEL